MFLLLELDNIFVSKCKYKKVNDGSRCIYTRIF